MSDLVPNFDQKKEIIQPQFSRRHYAYRSPRSSQELNLEMEQLRYDLSMLRSKTEGFASGLNERLTNLTEGADIGTAQYAASTVSDVEDLILVSLDTIFARIQEYETRIKRLQNKEGL